MKRPARLARFLVVCLLVSALLSVLFATPASAAGTSLPTAPCGSWTNYHTNPVMIYDNTIYHYNLGQLVMLQDSCGNKVAFAYFTYSATGSISLTASGSGVSAYYSMSSSSVSIWYSDVLSSGYTSSCASLRSTSGLYGSACHY